MEGIWPTQLIVKKQSPQQDTNKFIGEVVLSIEGVNSLHFVTREWNTKEMKEIEVQATTIPIELDG